MKLWPAAAFLVLLAACKEPPIQTPPSPSTTGRLFEDLPVPEGFTYSENISNTNPTGAFRVITQKLRGPNRRIEGAVNYYKAALPPHRWELEREDGKAPGPVKLSFVKKEERCRIEISDESPTVVRVVLKVDRKD